MGRIVGGIVACIAGCALLGGSSWLHEPGFAGDSDVRLLDGAAYGVLMVIGCGLVLGGALLIGQGAHRRKPTER